MKERRDTPYPALPEPAAPPAAHRSLSARRITPWSIALLGLIGLAIVAWQGFLRSAAWLQSQEAYRLPFGSIALDPEPPSWLKGGRSTFLERVRRNSQWPENISALGVELDQLARIFKLDPWVRGVDRIERGGPNHLTLRLVYRVPVATVPYDRGEILLDQDAVVLPGEDVELARVGPLVWISGLESPFDFRPGQALGTRKSTADPSGIDRNALAATKLAHFLSISSNAVDPSSPGRRIERIDPRKGEKQLLVQTAAKLWIVWGAAPGLEEPGEIAAEQKWSQLRRWMELHAELADHPDPKKVLVFEKEGPELREVTESSEKN